MSSKHHIFISDEDAAQYRVRYSPSAVKAAVSKELLAPSQIADAGQLLPAVSISASPMGRTPSTSSAHSTGSYSPSSNSVPLRNPYASPSPRGSPFPQLAPVPTRPFSPRYSTPADLPQLNGGSPYMSPGIGNVYMQNTYGTGYFTTQGMGPTYSPALSPASLSSCISGSSGSGTSSSSSSLHSSNGSPRSIISRSNSRSPPSIDPLLCGAPLDPYGKVAPEFANYMNNGFVAPAALHF